MTVREDSKARGKPTLRGVLQTLTVLAVLLALVFAAGGLLREKSGDKYQMYVYPLEDKQWDVIFAGSSHMNHAVLPMELWSDHGISAYNNAQSGQILPVSYYSVKEVIERYRPKLIVLDLYELYYPEKTGNVSWMHQSLDSMSAKNRIPAILELLGVSSKEYLLPLIKYHSRWSSLTSRDFDPGPIPYTLGCALNFGKAADLDGKRCEEVPADEKLPPPEIPRKYLEKIVSLCRSTDTGLLLVALPYFASEDYTGGTHDLTDDQKYMNWAADFAAEQGVPYLNYFHLTEKLGFSWTEHLYDYSHMNYFGAKLITGHLGRYLAEHYEMTDHRGEEAFAFMEPLKQQYGEYIAEQLQKTGAAD